ALDNLVLADREKDLEDLFTPDDAAAGPERMGELRVRYMLSRMLMTEARGASLLDLDAFAKPYDYQITIHRDGKKIDDQKVDLVETFNWLIGLRVQTLHAPRCYAMNPHRSQKHGRLVLTQGRRGRPAPDVWYPDANGPHWFRVVEGTVRDGDRAEGTPAIVIWRSLTGDLEVDNLALEAFLRSANLNLKERDNVTVWINGGHNVQNIRQAIPDGDGPDGTDAEVAGTGGPVPGSAPTSDLKIRLIEEDFHRLMFADTDSAGLA
ncbi:MAG TPA: hypothetical protein VGN75_08080, partial [Kaistia sp.]|nr:hypothetical protein [Kaistia sp.]